MDMVKVSGCCPTPAVTVAQAGLLLVALGHADLAARWGQRPREKWLQPVLSALPQLVPPPGRAVWQWA